MSLTTLGTSVIPSGTSTSTRTKSSISASASRTTSASAIGSCCSLAPVAPDSTTRLPALRRSRLDTWSSRYRYSSRSGSDSSRSSRSMSAICRPTRFWVRRPTCPNICATLRRLSTCRSTSRVAVPWTRSNARARSPISSRARTFTGSRWTGADASDSSSATRTSSVSAARATRSAERVNRLSGRATARATATHSSTTPSRTSTASPPTRYAVASALRCLRLTSAVTSETIFCSTTRPTPIIDSSPASATCGVSRAMTGVGSVSAVTAKSLPSRAFSSFCTLV